MTSKPKNPIGTIFALTSLAIALCITTLHGCGEGDATMVVKKPAAERPDVDRAIAAKGVLIVPTAENFNYSSFTSGQTGSARGESTAIGKDGARCAAQATDGGSGWGEFQIGYTFDNTTGAPLDAAIKLKLRLIQTQSATGPTSDARGTETAGKSSLRFFIKDSIGQTLKLEELATETLLKGPASKSDNPEIVFDARFEPDRGYYLVLAGRADLQSAAGANASIAIDVQQTTFEINWRPAEAKTATAAPQE